MEQIRIIIERSPDLYSAYAENVEGIYGGGDTVAEAKQSINEAIKIILETYDKKYIPPVLLGEYELVYKFDLQSLLDYYKGIFTNAALERITGINQKQLQHYSTGHRKPKSAQRLKIETALHNLGRELTAVEL